MGARPRLLFISQWFEPEPVYKGLTFVKALSKSGFELDVVTGVPNFPQGKLYSGYRVRPLQREVMDGIRVTRLPLYPSHDANSVRRSLNYISFFISAFTYLLFRTRRYDLIYVYHPPITVGLAAALAGLVRRTPFIIEIQDLWPDSVAASGMGNAKIEKALSWVCRFVYRRAARIVAQSQGMARMIASRGADEAKVRPVYNWAEETDIQPSGQLDLTLFGLERRFTFVYGGNLGLHQSLETVIDAAFKAASDAPHILLILVGSGVEFDKLRDRANAGPHGVVRVMAGIPRHQIADIFTAADVLLVHLADRPLYAFTVPSKTQFYLAMGKPILAGLTGEAAEIVKASGAGIVVPPQDSDAMARAMVQLAQEQTDRLRVLGRNGELYYRSKMSFASGNEKIVGIIQEVIGNLAPGGTAVGT